MIEYHIKCWPIQNVLISIIGNCHDVRTHNHRTHTDKISDTNYRAPQICSSLTDKTTNNSQNVSWQHISERNIIA